MEVNGIHLPTIATKSFILEVSKGPRSTSDYNYIVKINFPVDKKSHLIQLTSTTNI